MRIARIFNTYGPRMLENDGRVVSNFIVQALRGEEITIYGSGNQTRSFCYVSDLIEGLIRLMNVEGVNDPINLGNATNSRSKELAEEVGRACSVSTKIKYLQLPADDPEQRRPDTTRAEDVLEVVAADSVARRSAATRSRILPSVWAARLGLRLRLLLICFVKQKC